MKSIFLIALVCFSMNGWAQRIEPSWNELKTVMEMVPVPYSITYVGYHNWLDTNTYYLIVNKENDLEHGYICFKYVINKTWIVDRHFVICDCAPLDSAYMVIHTRYITDKKFRDSIDNR